MSGDLGALYQDVVIDHGKRPRNCRAIAGARTAEGHNPLCGDVVTVYVELAGEELHDVAFQGAACAVCTASASLMTEAVKGRAVAEALSLGEAVRVLLQEERESPNLGPLAGLAGVREFPSRVKCALLPWQTLAAALR